MARSRFTSRIHGLTLALMVSTALTAAFVVAPAQASTPPRANAQSVKETSSFTLAMDTVLTSRADRTAERVMTERIRVLGEAAMQSAGQQMRAYVEGMQTLEIVEAYTEKADGRKVPVDIDSIITRDGVNGIMMMFLDVKVRTLIFPDLAIGDTVVLTTRQVEKSGIYAGHFLTSFHSPRTVPLAESRVRIIAPKGLDLHVAIEGEGMETVTSEDADTITRTVTYRPLPRQLAEAGATSSADRDARILVSTLKTYEDMGRAYWAEAASRVTVTPEIAALAEQITKDIVGRREQAEAISRWVKRNIRYVAVYLGAARVVPNPAATVLKRKYGDCKDYVTLMSALLAAKGIASEQVLVSAGNTYTLPEPATMTYLNHVMLYVPEFKLYDDPTVSIAGFGVLSSATYDKPVIHMSANGVHLARTPAMRPEDHTVINRTKIAVAADGSMTGSTSEIATGIFATGLRTTAAKIQHDGVELSAARHLQGNGSPGKGRFDIGTPNDLAEPYVLRSTFSINQPAKLTPGGSAPIPYGLGTRVRPGGYLLGARLEGRQQPFVCYSGRMIEEIEVTFADELPLPRTPKPVTLSNRWLTYTAETKLDGRVMQIRREFMAHVPGQVCAPEVEKDVASLLKQVDDNVRTRMALTQPKKEASQVKPEVVPVLPSEQTRNAIVKPATQLN